MRKRPYNEGFARKNNDDDDDENCDDCEEKIAQKTTNTKQETKQ